MTIRHAELKDLKAVTEVEAACFPAAEAATEKDFAERLAVYPDYFWLMYDENKLVSFVNGMVTDEKDLTDEMYSRAAIHNDKGGWQMIFGVNTIPEYRNRGCAAEVLRQVISDAEKQKRKGIVLTCKKEKISYYAKFGFVNEGISDSVHGNVQWYQMRLTFGKKS
ncbi:MAG: GNAT family N-acetyltransferase [Clostridia bacterium]|nr:GNAT family N-acetyltransferase [Lachnospiraceae bacterium]NCB99970.1 GNAT family N-acetyltransferase [Clostridia bacterium]NCD03699.1 GNAT family N-acetyltransferase [Clostridia bacterium]